MACLLCKQYICGLNVLLSYYVTCCISYQNNFILHHDQFYRHIQQLFKFFKKITAFVYFDNKYLQEHTLLLCLTFAFCFCCLVCYVPFALGFPVPQLPCPLCVLVLHLFISLPRFQFPHLQYELTFIQYLVALMYRASCVLDFKLLELHLF